MAKRRAKIQIAILTPDHKKSRITFIFLRVGGMPHTVEKIFMRVITVL
jgi:hypothetical protein